MASALLCCWLKHCVAFADAVLRDCLLALVVTADCRCLLLLALLMLVAVCMLLTALPLCANDLVFAFSIEL